MVTEPLNKSWKPQLPKCLKNTIDSLDFKIAKAGTADDTFIVVEFITYASFWIALGVWV